MIILDFLTKKIDFAHTSSINFSRQVGNKYEIYERTEKI